MDFFVMCFKDYQSSPDFNDILPEKPKTGDYKRHLLICTGSRCTKNGESQALFDSLGEKFKAAGFDKGALRVKRSCVTCFATCKSGAIMCVQPDGVRYYNVDDKNLDRILEQHLIGGKPVEDLIFHQADKLQPYL